MPGGGATNFRGGGGRGELSGVAQLTLVAASAGFGCHQRPLVMCSAPSAQSSPISAIIPQSHQTPPAPISPHQPPPAPISPVSCLPTPFSRQPSVGPAAGRLGRVTPPPPPLRQCQHTCRTVPTRPTATGETRTTANQTRTIVNQTRTAVN